MNRLTYYLAAAVLTSALALIVYCGYLAFYPFKTLVFNILPIPVLTPTVRAGEDLVYEVDYCRYDMNGAIVFRTLVGPTFVPLPMVATITKPGCRKTLVHLTVPANTPPGIYYMEGRASIDINPLRTETKLFATEEFEVINPK